MPAREGTWNQGGGIEIPCSYEVSIKKSEKEKKTKAENTTRPIKARKILNDYLQNFVKLLKKKDIFREIIVLFINYFLPTNSKRNPIVSAHRL